MDYSLKRLPLEKDIDKMAPETTREDMFRKFLRDDTNYEKRLSDIYNKKPLLSSYNLSVIFRIRRTGAQKKQTFKAVDNVSLKVFPGEILGLVGESGCGKTTLGRALLRLTAPASGKIVFGNLDLTVLRIKSLKKIRKNIQIIFQDPYSSMNPRISIGKSLTEPMRVHGIGRNMKERRQKAIGLLQKVGMDEEHFYRYPHELSGGQRQRVCIARALAVNPLFLILDESVSSLDMSVQAQVLNMLKDLQEEFKLTFIFISHDLAVVKFISDRISVMKDGKIIETGSSSEIYRNPATEHTKKLIEAIPI
jgi:peptide/nickel transport system ATP-binding protein